MIIDGYAHCWTPKYMDELRRSPNQKVKEAAQTMYEIWKEHPNQIDLDLRLHDLDKNKIDLQVGAVHEKNDPNTFPLADNERLRLCRLLNDEAAQLMSISKNRIIPMGAAPLPSIEDGGLEEMRRAINDLGLKGFTVPTNVSGRPLDEFKSFWKEAARLDAVVYIHPNNPANANSRSYEADFDLMHTFGWPFETTLALSRLVFSGIMEECQNLKIVSHHLGGMLPFFMGRVNETYEGKKKAPMKGDQQEKARSKLSRPLLDYFKMFYYDTAVGGSVEAVRCGYGVFGADRLVFGTDYPWGPEEGRLRLATYPDMVKKACPSEEDQKKILGLNMKKLLKL